MRQEINAIGGQEVTMPVVHPADLWQETGRWYQIGSEMGRFQDKDDHDMVLAMTHEEVVADLVRSEIRSYRQLPALIYHIQTKWRDDPRPRAGLIRVREFTMLDSYSLDADFDGLDSPVPGALRRLFPHLRPLRAAGHRGQVRHRHDGRQAGARVHVPDPHRRGHADPVRWVRLHRQPPGGGLPQAPAGSRKPPRPIEKVATPHTTTIADLAALLGVPESRTAKAVFMMAKVADTEAERFVFAVIRGDMEVNETKLANAVGARALRPAVEAEIRAVGATPGYASPVGLKDVLVVVDDLIPSRRTWWPARTKRAIIC